MYRYFLLLIALTLSLPWSPSLTLAQKQPSPAGHWEGSIDLQFMKLGIIVSLSQKTDGAWEGMITIPSQVLKDSALGNVSVNGSAVSFTMPEVPGDPIYKAKLSEDGRMISGELTQSGRTFPFKLERQTEAEAAARQTYGVTPEKGRPGQGIEGYWQGTLNASGGLRLVLKIRKASDESLAAQVDSPDQKITDLLVDNITLKDKSLHFEIKRVRASYQGTLSQDGSEISGQWEQQGVQLPLTFRRLAEK
ncbi:MAG: hypothetical protein AB1489_05870 [Acidobacteriota bacterium]